MGQIQETETSLPHPVQTGSVLANLMSELHQLVSELSARRRFDDDVSAWLKEFGFSKDFEVWRTSRSAKDPGDPPR